MPTEIICGVSASTASALAATKATAVVGTAQDGQCLVTTRDCSLNVADALPNMRFPSLPHGANAFNHEGTAPLPPPNVTTPAAVVWGMRRDVAVQIAPGSDHGACLLRQAQLSWPRSGQLSAVQLLLLRLGLDQLEGEFLIITDAWAGIDPPAPRTGQ